jgi:rhodanese-related sulfurtransferase
MRINTRLAAGVAVAMAMAFAATTSFAVEDTPMSIPGGTYVTTEKAKEHFDKGALFIDARVATEYADKHIKGASNVVFKEKYPKVAQTDPEDAFDASKLPGDKGKPMVFYCNGTPCWKAYKAAAAAIQGGYKNVLWFRDGLPAWVASGYPTE